MNKKLILAAGLMTLMVGFTEASFCSSSAVNCDETSAAVVSTEELLFVSKLSQDYAIAFELMKAEERLEVLISAQKRDLTPDAAVESFMTQHQLAVVNGTLTEIK